MMEIKVKIETLEVDGDINQQEMQLKSHWNRDNLIVLMIGKKELTFDGDEFKSAINAVTDWK